MKRIKKLLVLILALSMLISNSVYAEDYNGTEGDGSQSTSKYAGAASFQKTGIVLYIIDKQGNMVGTAGRIFHQSPNSNLVMISTRYGKMDLTKSATSVVTDMPTPFVADGNTWSSNGLAVRDWLMNGTTKGIPNYKLYLRKFIGEAYYSEIFLSGKNSNYSIVVESLMWCNTWKGDTRTNDILQATAWGWAKLHIKNGMPNGSSILRKATNSALPLSMILERDFAGLSRPSQTSGIISCQDILDYGYGMHVIDLNSDIATTKTDEPAAMEVDTANIGTYNVIKCYENQVPLEDGQIEPVYEPYKTFVVTNAPANIYVESEESYTVTDWAILNTKVNSTDSYDKILSGKTPIETGTSDSEVALDATKPTLVVRLRDNSDLVLDPRTINVSGI